MSVNWTVSLLGGFGGTNLQKGETVNYIGNYFKALILLLPVSISMVTGAGTAAFGRAAQEFLATSVVAEVGKILHKLCVQIFQGSRDLFLLPQI